MKNLFKLIILFLCTIFALPVCAKNVSVTVVSNACISVDRAENTMTPSIKKLLQFTEQANADTSSLVVFLGNNVNSSDRVNLAMFSKIIKKIKKPVYVTLGEKDTSKTRELQRKEYYRILNKFSKNKLKTVPSYQKYDDLILIFMAGVNETIPNTRGYYRASEVDFLDRTLAQFQDKKAIIFQQFPVVSPDSDPDKITVRAEDYISVLNKHKNVLAVISGHYGKENVTTVNGVKHINIGSLNSQGEYEQIKIFKNKDGSYSMTERVFDVLGN